MKFALYLNFAVSYAYLFNRNLNRGLGQPHTDLTAITPSDQYFEQKLDHFDPTNEDTWYQRYWRNSAHYVNGGPAFLLINGEAEASPKWAITGQWISYAQHFGADCYSLEHRFYGQSRPKNDTSSPNLLYLSSEQALADIAYFIKGITDLHALPDTTKWIVFGGSYAGSLAAWARLKYPYLIHGAVSSSGPLLAKVDFKEYFQVVKQSLDSYSTKCASRVALANRELNTLVNSASGREKIAKMFRLCHQLDTTPDDVSSLFADLADNFAGVVQYNKDNRQSNTKSITIDKICDIMDTVDQSAIHAYARVNQLMLNAYNLSCLDHRYQQYIDQLRNIDYENASSSGRQWIYQTCTEFGFYQTSASFNDTFGGHFDASFYTKQCEQIFGRKYTFYPANVTFRFDEKLLTNAIYRTNTIYGQLKINVANIIFVHGTIDPWHALGITRKPDNDADYQTIFIKGTAHCADMYPSSDDDVDELRAARIEINKILHSWLQTKPKRYKVRLTYQSNLPITSKDYYAV